MYLDSSPATARRSAETPRRRGACHKPARQTAVAGTHRRAPAARQRRGSPHPPGRRDRLAVAARPGAVRSPPRPRQRLEPPRAGGVADSATGPGAPWRRRCSGRQHRPAQQHRDRGDVLGGDELHARVARAAVDAQRRSHRVARHRVDQDARRPVDGQLSPLRARARAAAEDDGRRRLRPGRVRRPSGSSETPMSGSDRRRLRRSPAPSAAASRPALGAAMKVAAFDGLTAIIGVGWLAVA